MLKDIRYLGRNVEIDYGKRVSSINPNYAADPEATKKRTALAAKVAARTRAERKMKAPVESWYERRMREAGISTAAKEATA